jgi:hypothetical protein
MRPVVGEARSEWARRRVVRVIGAMRGEMDDRRQLGRQEEEPEQEGSSGRPDVAERLMATSHARGTA